MSANNELVISKLDDGLWYVDDCDIDDIDAEGGHFINDKGYRTLENAIKAANKYMEDNLVEYGLRIELDIGYSKFYLAIM